ncbi:MAG: hypothetical protein KKB79_02405, partial [Nanoarchaeota archaeon]|nr:hypothetical protein [Nanoarchaeota archaeon]
MEEGNLVRNVSSKTLDEIDRESEEEDLKKLEAIFFVSGRFLNVKDIITLSDLNPIIIREVIEKLIKNYEERD